MTAYNRAFFTHFMLAVAALLMTQLSDVLLQQHAELNYLILVFFSSLFIYRLAYYHKVFPLRNIPVIDRIILISSVLLIIFSAFTLAIDKLLGLAGMFIGCLAYFIKVGSWNGLRSVTFLKSVWLAFIWSLATVWIPLDFSLEPAIILLLAERFLFMLAICIIYNLRDMNYDDAGGVKTIPHQIGIPLTKVLCIFLLMLNQALVMIHPYPFAVNVALSVSIALTVLMVVLAKRNGPWLFYTLLIDGSMILQFLLVMLAVKNPVN